MGSTVNIKDVGRGLIFGLPVFIFSAVKELRKRGDVVGSGVYLVVIGKWWWSIELKSQCCVV
jgi:hypothetical protein